MEKQRQAKIYFIQDKEVAAGFAQERRPKCGGNVYLDRDYYGWYEKCLQCAYTRDLKNVVEVRGKVS